ncbi:MAG: hypothetical protein JSU65_12660 [Candidatus Zixiibacteriota bacterium]|nr:MAG: hypothetical protein JSU65_12660 [candidate division Zixibacteria bacterium]
MRQYTGSLILPAVLAVLIVAGFTGKVVGTEFVSHELHIKIDVPSHRANITDQGLLNVAEGQNIFLLNHGAQITHFELDGAAIAFVPTPVDDTAGLSLEQMKLLSEIDENAPAQLVLFQFDRQGQFPFVLKYTAEFFEDVTNTRFSREHVGGEINGTILDQGAYLSSGSYFYPAGDESLLTFAVTVDIPQEWESISDGNRSSSEIREGRKVQRFENPYQTDGITVMAAPYVTKSAWMDSVEVSCYFFEADTGLIDRYLNATVDYVRMYSELIGPYPYERFTVAENFFPTGYGMPAWTLLGQQVIRLPFIIGTSLGHEVLHNWWGNSVYVDYEAGNWCEGLTVYGADYRYKLNSSPAETRDYRKDILKQYVSYINEGNDFPVREFKSRTSPGTRTIGYSKVMMIFHMIHEVIGEGPFFQAWRNIYETHRGEKVTWEQWIEAFEAASGRQLDYILNEWVDRSGAPSLAVRLDGAADNDRGRLVDFTLSQTGGQEYRLNIPVRFSGIKGRLDTVVVLASAEATFSIQVPSGYWTLAVDPDYHLFRRLYPEEVEPVVSAILGNPAKKFVSFDSQAEAVEMFTAFCGNFMEGEVELADPGVMEEGEGFYPIVLNPRDMPEYLAGLVRVNDDSVTIGGAAYSREGHTFVLTGQDWNGVEKYIVLLTGDYASLPRLGQLVPHYGKYSYLVFAGPRNVGKGQWEVTDSPLRISF